MNLVSKVLSDPETVAMFSPADWDLLVRQGRRSVLLGRIYWLLNEHDLLETVPEYANRHLLSSFRIYEKLRLSARYEIFELFKLFESLDVPLVLLKGGAYISACSNAGEGRLFSDLDILVPEEKISEVERHLTLNGWYSPCSDAYDQRYYRQWMHEIPPLQHVKRKVVLDIHHNILPRTGKISVDSNKLLNGAVLAEERLGWALSEKDRILHSAAHLFHDGELDHGLRDLSDLDLLVREFSAEEDFWESLLARSVELNLQRPLFYALRYTNEILNTPVPEEVLKVSKAGSPGKIMTFVMDALFLRALAPDHPSCDDRWTGLARWMLFIRSHWLRMPPLQLAQHLARKGYKRWTMRNNIT